MIQEKGKEKGLNQPEEVRDRKSPKRFGESQRFLEELVETAGNLIVLTDPDGRIVLFNRACEDVTGYKRHEVFGKTIPELFLPPEWVPVVQKRFADPYAPEVRAPHENPWLTKSGEERIIEWRCAVIPSPEDGRPCILGTGTDITERKRAEEAVQESEEKYRALVENSPNFVGIVQDGFLKYANRAHERLGWTIEEVTSPSFNFIERLDSSEFRDVVRDSIANRFRGQVVPPYEIDLLKRDGSTIPVAVLGTIITYQGRAANEYILTDITERKRIEEKLKQSEDRFRGIAERSFDAILTVDLEGRITYASPALERMTGYSQNEVIGASFQRFLPESEISRGIRILTQALEGEIAESVEANILKKDGSIARLEFHASPILSDGKLTGFQGIARDVTERKRAEEALRRRAEELAALQATVLDVTGSRDLPMLLETIVERAARLLGAPAGGMYLCDSEKQEARCVVSYNTPHDYTGTVLKYGEGAAGIVAQTGKPLVIDDYRTWQGRATVFEEKQPFSALLTVPMIWQDRVTGVIHVLDDTASRRFTQADQELLTLFANHAAIAVENTRLLEQEKHHAEELARYSTSLEQLVLERTRKLGESERRFRELAELLPQIVFEMDEKGSLTFLNHAAFASTGYSEDDLRRGLNAFQMFVPEEHDRARQSIRALLSGEKLSGHEYTILRKGGSTFPAVVYAARVMRENRAAGLRGIVIDITERKRMETELVKSERLATIGETAAMVGHDLRNPLTGMMGAAHYLRTKEGTRLSGKGKEMIELIEEDIQRSDKIINDLLEYSKELHLELSQTNVKSITQDALAEVKIPKGIRVVNSTKNQPQMKLDVDKMRRVFLNLIRNAVDAMPNGGTLKIASNESNGNLQITFRDTGEGMTTENLVKVWSPLFTTKAKGIGLGLPIAKRLVEAHGGSINVESKARRGSTFTVTLPIKPNREEVKKK